MKPDFLICYLPRGVLKGKAAHATFITVNGVGSSGVSSEVHQVPRIAYFHRTHMIACLSALCTIRIENARWHDNGSCH